MDTVFSAPLAIYVVIAIIVSIAISRILSDVREVVRTRHKRSVLFSLAQAYFRPSLLVVVRYSTIDATQQVIEDICASYDSVHICIMLDAQVDKQAAAKLRRITKRAHLDNVSISCTKQPDSIGVARRYAKKYDLITTLPDTAQIHPKLYQELLLSLADEEIAAVSAPAAILPGVTLWSAVVSTLSCLTRGGNSTPASVGALLESGAIVRSHAIYDTHMNVSTNSSALYAMQNAPLEKVRCESKPSNLLRLMTPVAGVLATYIAGLPVLYVFGLWVLLTYYFVWQSTTNSQMRIYQRTSLILLAPFTYCVALFLFVIIHYKQHYKR